MAQELCHQQEPELRSDDNGHRTACHLLS
jgi:hypothetical protein